MGDHAGRPSAAYFRSFLLARVGRRRLHPPGSFTSPGAAVVARKNARAAPHARPTVTSCTAVHLDWDRPPFVADGVGLEYRVVVNELGAAESAAPTAVGQATKRDGRTMWEQVQTKLAERKKKQQQTKLPFTAAPAEATNGDAAAASSSSDGEKEEGRSSAAAPAAAPPSMTKKASAGGDDVAMPEPKEEEGGVMRTWR